MNIVEQAVVRVGSQVKLAEQLSEITGHPYKQPHIANWKRVGYFPADVASVVARFIFDNEVSTFDICPAIKRPVEELG